MGTAENEKAAKRNLVENEHSRVDMSGSQHFDRGRDRVAVAAVKPSAASPETTKADAADQ